MPEQPQKVDDHLQERVDNLKEAIVITFEKLDDIEKEIVDLQKKKSSLKRDLNDLKEGRLDRIEDRHNIDGDSAKNSMFTVSKKVVIGKGESNPWYIPFMVEIRGSKNKFEINNSMTKINAQGSYKLKNGEIRFL